MFHFPPYTLNTEMSIYKAELSQKLWHHSSFQKRMSGAVHLLMTTKRDLVSQAIPKVDITWLTFPKTSILLVDSKRPCLSPPHQRDFPCHPLLEEQEESLVATYIFNPHRIRTILTKTPDLETEKSMGTFSGQLGGDVPVTPVPLAALHSLAGWRRGLTGHLPLLIDLEAAFLVDVEAIVYAQRGKALLAFTVVLISTGEAFTHTHVKSRVNLGLLICKGKRERKTKKKSLHVF